MPEISGAENPMSSEDHQYIDRTTKNAMSVNTFNGGSQVSYGAEPGYVAGPKYRARMK